MKPFIVCYENAGQRGYWRTEARNADDARRQFRRDHSALWYEIWYVSLA